MTESDWLTATVPHEMLRALGTPSERKLRLFAVSCCRRYHWNSLTDERSRAAVEVSERFADGDATEEERQAAFRAGRVAAEAASRSEAWREAWAAAWVAALGPGTATEAVRKGGREEADLLRDIFGPNPFAAPPRIDPTWLSWNEGIIPKLAEAAYQERSLPSGELDRERLAVLADALEEVGADAVLLGHLRGPGPHVRGDWMVDLLTGREASP